MRIIEPPQSVAITDLDRPAVTNGGIVVSVIELDERSAHEPSGAVSIRAGDAG